MVCVPTPAVAGLNCPEATPVPEYVPPAGIPPVNSKATASEHTVGKADKVTVGGVSIVIGAEAEPEHPF